MNTRKETLCSLLEELIRVVEKENKNEYKAIKKQVVNLAEDIYGEKLETLSTEETVLVNGIINSLTYIYPFPERREELLERAKKFAERFSELLKKKGR